ncbi:MAG: hypothetical protein JOY54_01040 [Acidobacteriaceae bacterium]|nr:hypothetical protein [Acidobacteriaceae bacterium]
MHSTQTKQFSMMAATATFDFMRAIILGVLMLAALASNSSARTYQVYGAILDRYQILGGERGPLGAPLSDEADAPHGGRFNRFQNGIILFHPETGAHAVYGAIYQKYTQFGQTEYGYPITDESGLPDGRGRFNHFRQVHLPGKPETSIYWTPQTGTHTVWGGFRDAWARWEWERGKLGYPISDDYVAGGLHRQDFEFGWMTWTPQQPVTVETFDTVSETMTDRCSSDVSFPSVYGGGPLAAGSTVLQRGADGYSHWTPIFSAGLDGSGHVRWWCHSTTGNAFDPGTWRVRDDKLACTLSGGGQDSGGGSGQPSSSANVKIDCTTTVNLVAVDANGWTAEQSRCNDHSSFFRARLGPDRLLEIMCAHPK